jgi:hypothetical protein
MVCPLTTSVCIKLTTLPPMASVGNGTYLQIGTFPVGARAFILKSRMSQSEYTMNIFYIIGVVVVIIFVAGFFGLHA